MALLGLRSRRLVAALFLVALLVPAVVAGQARSAPAPVDPAVVRQLTGAGTATFWVLLRARPNLRPAAATVGWAQRGSAVVAQLQANARASQAALLPLLSSPAVSYRSFWIANAIQVTAGRATLDALTVRPEVAKIVADQPRRIPPPRDRSLQAAASGVEWNVERVRAPEVWSTFGDRGEGIVVGSIDTGVQFDHPALVGQYRGNHGGGVFDHSYNWFDAVGVCEQPAPCDPIFHGTHTMGTIVGDDGDDGANQIGVAPRARWITAKACDYDGCFLAPLLAAGEWMLAPTDLDGGNPRPDLRPQIINNSWGGPFSDDFFQQIVDAWEAAGIFAVFSAGNDGPFCATIGSPGDYANAYTVGAFGADNAIAQFSSRGPGLLAGAATSKPDIAAPGVEVRSSVPGNIYAAFSGTSMAAPHVAGAVALLWSISPVLAGDVASTRKLLGQAAIDVDDTSCEAYPATTADNLRNNVWGEGRLDIFAAVERAPRGPTGVISGTIADAASGAAIGGARIEVSGSYQRTISASPAGTFALSLPVGNYTLSVSAFGYLAQTVADLQVAAGQTTLRQIGLAALPAFPLSGQVRDSAGRPLANVRVDLGATPLAPAISDLAGFYRFASVPTGVYTITATPSGCNQPLAERIELSAELTHTITLAPARDGYGYSCALEPASYIAASTPLIFDDYTQQAALPLPFPFTFYGQTYDTAYVSPHGLLNFLGGVEPYGPSRLPSRFAPNAAIYPFWEYFLFDSTASVRSELVGSAPNRELVIEWRDLLVCCDSDERVTFEVVLGEQGQIVMQYADLGDSERARGGSASIGIEDERGTTALQYAYLTPVLDTRLAVRYALPPSGFVQGQVTDVSDGLPIAGALVRALQGGALACEVTSNAQGAYQIQLPLGSYTIEASSQHYSTAAISATLATANERVAHDFRLATGHLAVAPPAIEQLVPVGQQRTLAMTIQNTGALPLEWRLGESGATPGVPPPAQAQQAMRAPLPLSWRAPELPAGLALALPAQAPGDALATVISDPAGDAQGQIDITSLRGGAPNGSDLTLAIDFSADTPIDQLFGYVLLDTDQSAASGLPPTDFLGRPEQDIGVDYYAIVYGLQYPDAQVPIFSAASGMLATVVPAHVISNTLTFSLPLAALGDEGLIDAALVLGDGVGPTDWAPDRGHGTIEPFTDIPWLSVSADHGTLAPGASQTLAVTLSAEQIAAGVYDAALLMQSDSGRQPQLRVPVRLLAPAYHQALNAGGAAYRDQAGELWAADQTYRAGGWGYLDRGKLLRTSKPIAGTADDPLYQDARSGQLEYRFDGLPAGVYEVELRFAELEGQRRGERLFDVVIEGLLALPAHDIAGEAGALAANDRVTLVLVRDGQLNIRFVPRANYGAPLINAIRVSEYLGR